MLYRQIIISLKKHFQNYFIFYFILVLFFVFGIIIGPLVIQKISHTVRMVFIRLSHPFLKDIYMGEYVSFSMVKTSIFNNILLILMITVLGLLNFGFFLIPFLISLKGLFIGITVAFLVESYGVRGFLSSLIGIYPQNIFIIGGLIGIGAVSMSMSYNMRVSYIKNPLWSRNININEYIFMILIFLLPIIIGSIIEGILSPKILQMTIESFY